MTSTANLIKRVRKELGDLLEPFRETYRGTGEQDEFDLPVLRVSEETLKVFTVADGVITDLALNTHYTVSSETGVLRLKTGPLAADVLLVVEGAAFGLFTDDELAEFVTDALLQHNNERYESVRFRDADGFIKYERFRTEVENLPEVEHLPVALLATIEALWALATDASTDIDINTSEGTFVPRSQRFAQIQTQIELLTQKYRDLCAMLNVGLYRIETFNLRRVSRTNNRLVPIYAAREYDEHGLPTRILPAIDRRDSDPDGPASPADRGLY